MLSLDDPLWEKLDDTFCDESVPSLISQLSMQWQDEVANSLFWDRLCHQDTCYGATYAVAPYLLKLAEPEENRMQRSSIALFLGHVANVAFDTSSCCGSGASDGQDHPLQGLPKTKTEWDKKLEPFRYMVSAWSEPHRKLTEYEKSQIPVYQEILSRPQINDDDLVVIQQIEDEFLASLPAIEALCERAYFEALGDEVAPLYHLAGVASAARLQALGDLLEAGREGWFKCGSCGWRHDYQLLGDKLAYYADDLPPGTMQTRDLKKDRKFLDYQAAIPSRADGFVEPVNSLTDTIAPKNARILELANKAHEETLPFLVRCFLGQFQCVKCGAYSSLRRR